MPLATKASKSFAFKRSIKANLRSSFAGDSSVSFNRQEATDSQALSHAKVAFLILSKSSLVPNWYRK